MLLAMHTAICLRFILTGKVSDYRCALALIDGIKTDALLADKGYNANYIVEAAQNMGAIAVIPPKSNRIIQREYDKASCIRSVILLKDYSTNSRISAG